MLPIVYLSHLMYLDLALRRALPYSQYEGKIATEVYKNEVCYTEFRVHVNRFSIPAGALSVVGTYLLGNPTVFEFPPSVPMKGGSIH